MTESQPKRKRQFLHPLERGNDRLSCEAPGYFSMQ
jgi:hypothetical protein